MGHMIFCILHLFAFLFGFIGLVITIPLHLIYSAAKGPRKPRTGPKTKCPFCKEQILKGAVVCKHCGKDIPEEEKPQEILVYEALRFCKDIGKDTNISLINLAIIIAVFLLIFAVFAPLRPF